jgi:hypothetical protein
MKIMMRRTFKLNYLIALMAGIGFGFGCNTADKKSSMEKDSIGNDTVVNDVVGGVETFETNMEEEAADFLKAAGTSLVIQDSIMTVALKAPGNSAAKAYAKQARERIQAQKKTLETFCNDNKVLLKEDLRHEQIDSLRRLSKQTGTAFNRQFQSWLSTEMLRRLAEYEKAGNARQQRVRKFVKEELPKAKKELELLAQAGLMK